MSASSRQGEEPSWLRPLHLAAVFLAAVLLLVPGLGRRGLSATEGHRVIPGWEMVESGSYWLPTMFGQAYLRKPPGMPWAVALFSGLFGQTEFAARLVSVCATVGLALIATVFGARWFGRRWGLAAGMTAVLTPLLWDPARAAEIEALNNVAAAAAVLLLLDVLVYQVDPAGGSRSRGRLIGGVLAGLAMAMAGLVKGPAALPAVAAAVIAACAVRRSWRPLAAPGLWLAVGVAGVVAGGSLLRVRAAVEASGQTPVLQGVSDFLWTGRAFNLGSVGAVVVMPLLALLAAFPACMAMLFPWGPDAKAEAKDVEAMRRLTMARAVTITAVGGIFMLAVMGVRNPRYAQPCVAFVPVLVAYFVRGWGSEFFIIRQRIASVLMLGHPAVLGAALAIAAVLAVHDPFGWRADTSGRGAGREIGRAMQWPGEVWSDHVIDARPETLWYAKEEAGRGGIRVVPRWVPGLAREARVPPAGSYLLLRQDVGSDEVDPYTREGLLAGLELVAYGRVHKYGYVLYRVPGSPE